MSTLTTPRAGTQATNRSRTRSVIPSHSEPKRKGPGGLGGSTERLSTAASHEKSERSSNKGETTSRIEEQPEVVEKPPEVTDLPFFKQDQFTDVVLQVYFLKGKLFFILRNVLQQYSEYCKLAEIIA